MPKRTAVDSEKGRRRMCEGGLKPPTPTDAVWPDGTRMRQAWIDSPEYTALSAGMVRSAKSERRRCIEAESPGVGGMMPHRYVEACEVGNSAPEFRQIAKK